MHKIIATLFAVGLMVGPASASETLDVMRTVWQFVGSFNKGDVKTALGDCAAQSSIIDEFPPYIWQGATGCADWSKDFAAYIKKNNMTDPKVTLGLLRHVDVSGDRAYVVVPANFTFKKMVGGLTSSLQSGQWLCRRSRIVGLSQAGRGRSISGGIIDRCGSSTTVPSFSSHQTGSGYALVSPRPSSRSRNSANISTHGSRLAERTQFSLAISKVAIR